jgi:acyl-coenzyme A thioesterase PaaI-like protein
MAASTEPKDAPMFTEKTLPILADGYNNLPPHVFAGFRIVQNDDGDWVGRLEVDDNTGRGGYLHGGPWFYGRTIDTQASMLRAPRIGTIVEFRGQVDRVAGGIAQTRAEAWALLPDGPKLVATGSASKAIMDRRERPRIGDIDLAKVT